MNIIVWIIILYVIIAAVGKKRESKGGGTARSAVPPVKTARPVAPLPAADRFEEPEEQKDDPEHSHEGYHEPLEESGEGEALEESSSEEGPQRTRDAAAALAADPCRVVRLADYRPAEGTLDLTGLPARTIHRASRRSGSVARSREDTRRLIVNSDGLLQGVLWTEILNKRGGRKMH
jgi:hypothetical protein